MFGNNILKDNATGKTESFGKTAAEYARAAQWKAERLAQGHTVSDCGTGTLESLRTLGYDDKGVKHNTGLFGLF